MFAFISGLRRPQSKIGRQLLLTNLRTTSSEDNLPFFPNMAFLKIILCWARSHRHLKEEPFRMAGARLK